MDTLSREYALSRTGVVLFMSFCIMGIVTSKCMISFACAIITVVYYLSLRKHSAKIVKLMHRKKNGSEDSDRITVRIVRHKNKLNKPAD